mmetsp:Transcript_46030/g.115891  ORF Transcript_46030/g.115891 Transcript_46030/m.115891 type:complete len:262 (+) Transcript_46030:565-1350(+)
MRPTSSHCCGSSPLSRRWKKRHVSLHMCCCCCDVPCLPSTLQCGCYAHCCNVSPRRTPALPSFARKHHISGSTLVPSAQGSHSCAGSRAHAHTSTTWLLCSVNARASTVLWPLVCSRCTLPAGSTTLCARCSWTLFIAEAQPCRSSSVYCHTQRPLQIIATVSMRSVERSQLFSEPRQLQLWTQEEESTLRRSTGSKRPRRAAHGKRPRKRWIATRRKSSRRGRRRRRNTKRYMKRRTKRTALMMSHPAFASNRWYSGGRS